MNQEVTENYQNPRVVCYVSLIKRLTNKPVTAVTPQVSRSIITGFLKQIVENAEKYYSVTQLIYIKQTIPSLLFLLSLKTAMV